MVVRLNDSTTTAFAIPGAWIPAIPAGMTGYDGVGVGRPHHLKFRAVQGWRESGSL